MGVFKVRARERNLLNDYLPEQERGQDVECDLTVDTGAAERADRALLPRCQIWRYCR
jgi:hypothetical protein